MMAATIAATMAATTGVTFARGALAWLLTYGVHGAIAAVATELVTRLARPSPADAHRLWRMALVLPLSTACLFVLFGGHPLAGTLLPTWPVVLHLENSAALSASLTPSTGGRATLVVALIAALGVVVGGARFLIELGRLRRGLANDRTPADPRLRSALARLSRRFALADVQLSESASVGIPLAVGARAICFPAGSIARMGDSEVDAVLAHELAHIERGDPRWFLCAGLVEAALWMQPANRFVAARLRRTAEIACDERAVAITGDPLGLARALSWFAHAAFGARARRVAQVPLPGAAQASKALVDRVRRLATSGPTPVPSRTSAARFAGEAALLTLMAITSATLGVTLRAMPPVSATPAPIEAPPADALDIAAVSRRVADLDARAVRLEAALAPTQVVASGASTNPAPPHILELEQDLRHTREERAWLERIVTRGIRP